MPTEETATNKGTEDDPGRVKETQSWGSFIRGLSRGFFTVLAICTVCALVIPLAGKIMMWAWLTNWWEDPEAGICRRAKEAGWQGVMATCEPMVLSQVYPCFTTTHESRYCRVVRKPGTEPRVYLYSTDLNGSEYQLRNVVGDPTWVKFNDTQAPLVINSP